MAQLGVGGPDFEAAWASHHPAAVATATGAQETHGADNQGVHVDDAIGGAHGTGNNAVVAGGAGGAVVNRGVGVAVENVGDFGGSGSRRPATAQRGGASSGGGSGGGGGGGGGKWRCACCGHVCSTGHALRSYVCVRARASACVCVCVCVCE